jgi:hypothetical protein
MRRGVSTTTSLARGDLTNTEAMNCSMLMVPLGRHKDGPHNCKKITFKPCHVMDWEKYCFVPAAGGAADKKALKLARTHARAHVARLSHPGARRNRKHIDVPDTTKCSYSKATNVAGTTRAKLNLPNAIRLQSVFQGKFCLILYSGIY